METLKEYIDYLTSNGYFIDEDSYPYEYLNDELISVTVKNKRTKRYIILNCYYPEDLIKDLVKRYGSNPDAEYDVMSDEIASRIIVSGALIESNIVNCSNFFNGEKHGICLCAEGDGSDLDFSDYYKHRLNLFEKCVWIQNHETEHAVNIMKRHFENVAFFDQNIKPIIEPDYSNVYDSLIDVLEREDSDPTFIWKLDDTYDEYEIWFHTDCITGTFHFTVPYGTEDEKSMEFSDAYGTFNRDEFVKAVNRSKERGRRMVELYNREKEMFR